MARVSFSSRADKVAQPIDWTSVRATSLTTDVVRRHYSKEFIGSIRLLSGFGTVIRYDAREDKVRHIPMESGRKAPIGAVTVDSCDVYDRWLLRAMADVRVGSGYTSVIRVCTSYASGDLFYDPRKFNQLLSLPDCSNVLLAKNQSGNWVYFDGDGIVRETQATNLPIWDRSTYAEGDNLWSDGACHGDKHSYRLQSVVLSKLQAGDTFDTYLGLSQSMADCLKPNWKHEYAKLILPYRYWALDAVVSSVGDVRVYEGDPTYVEVIVYLTVSYHRTSLCVVKELTYDLFQRVSRVIVSNRELFRRGIHLENLYAHRASVEGDAVNLCYKVR